MSNNKNNTGDCRPFNLGMFTFFIHVLTAMAVTFHDKSKKLIESKAYDGTAMSLVFWPSKAKKQMTFTLRFSGGPGIYPVVLECARRVNGVRVAVSYNITRLGLIAADGPRAVPVDNIEAATGFIQELAAIEAHADYALSLHDETARENIVRDFNNRASDRANAVMIAIENADGTPVGMWQ